MAGSPADAEQLARGILAHYEEAERELLRLLANRLAKGGEGPDWVERKLAQVRAFKRQAEEVVRQLQMRAADSADLALAEAYRRGGLQAVYDLERAGTAATVVDPLAGLKAIEALQQATMTSLNSSSLRILTVMGEAYQEIVSQTVQQVLLGAMTRTQATQSLLTKFAQKGVTGFTDIAGRNWNLNTYAEMVTRTGSAQAWRQGHLDTLLQNEVDLVIISDAPSSCPICEMFEGEIFSISGKSNEYPPLDDAINDGLFHCNCRHGFSPWEDGITRPLEKAQSHEQNAAGYAASQRQRSLERQIRAGKREQAVATEPAAAAKANKKIQVARQKIRNLLDEHPELRRKPFRESMGVSKAELAKLREEELARVREMGQMARPELAPATDTLEALSKPDAFGARWTADRKFSIEGQWPYTAHYLAPDGIENMGVFNTVKEAREAIAARRLQLVEKPVVPKPIEKPVVKPEPEIVSKPDEWGMRWTDDREFYISGKWPYDLYHKTKLADGTFSEAKLGTFNTVKEAREAIGIQRAKVIEKPKPVELEELEKITADGNRWAKDQQYVIRGLWPYTLSKNVDGNLVDIGTFNTVKEAREALRVQRAEDLLKPVIPKPKPVEIESLTKPDNFGRRWTADKEYYVEGTYPYTLWYKDPAGVWKPGQTYESVKLAKAKIAELRGGAVTAKPGKVELFEVDKDIKGVRRWKVTGNEDYYITTDSYGNYIVRHNVAKPGAGLKFYDDVGSAKTLEDARLIIQNQLYSKPATGEQLAALEKRMADALAKEKVTGKLVHRRVTGKDMIEVPAHPDYRIRIGKDNWGRDIYTAEHLVGTKWEYVHSFGSKEEAVKLLTNKLVPKIVADQKKLTYVKPATMKQANKVLEQINPSAKFVTKVDSRFSGKEMDEAWQVMHADQLVKELVDMFNRFPKMRRDADALFYDIRVGRASSYRGTDGMTWSYAQWQEVSYMTHEQQFLRYLGGSKLHPPSSFFPGRSVDGTIRHEYCHSLQSWNVMREWEEILAGMGNHKGKFNSWYKTNISQYVSDHPNQAQGYEVESMAECFTRWTEAPPRRMDVSQWPQEVQDFMNKLCNGEFH